MIYLLSMIVALMLAGCASYEPVVWISGDSDALRNDDGQSVGLRAGLQHNDIEAGLTSNWYTSSDSGAPQTYGLYGVYYLPEPLVVGGVEAKVYVGGQVGLGRVLPSELDGDGDLARLFCGVHGPYNTYIEYRYDMYGGDLESALNSEDDSKIAAGFRIAIK